MSHDKQPVITQIQSEDAFLQGKKGYSLTRSKQNMFYTGSEQLENPHMEFESEDRMAKKSCWF